MDLTITRGKAVITRIPAHVETTNAAGKIRILTKLYERRSSTEETSSADHCLPVKRQYCTQYRSIVLCIV